MAPIILALFLIVGFVLFLGMIAFFISLISRAAKRRAYDTGRGSEMRAIAAQISFSFTSQAELSAIPFFASFELFEGYALKFENLMQGSIGGHRAAVFDLAYRNVGSGGRGGTTTSRQTMYAIESTRLNLPEIYLRPEGVMERVLNTLDRVDIDFAERPGFSGRFMLYGKDENAIRHLFTAAKLDFFERTPNLCVFGRGNHLFLYQSRTPSQPAQIQQNVMFLGALHDLFAQ
ncbi:MAG: hypothetical protein WBD16_14115 [Pyrinomonadaceae bacterium]